MKRSVIVLVLASILLVGVLASLSFAGAPPIIFTVTSAKAEYNRSEQIALTLTLENTSASDVTVSAYSTGNVSLAYVKHNGTRIRPTGSVALFEEDPRFLQSEALVTLAPGTTVNIPFYVQKRSVGSSVSVFRLGKKQEDKELTYELIEPGLFVLRFRYKYSGSDNGKPNVYHKSVKSNELTFTLQ